MLLAYLEYLYSCISFPSLHLERGVDKITLKLRYGKVRQDDLSFAPVHIKRHIYSYKEFKKAVHWIIAARTVRLNQKTHKTMR